MPATSPIIILDAGSLVALADAGDPHNAWAAGKIGVTGRPFIVTSAAIAEASHVLNNGMRAIEFLEKLVARMHVEDPAPVAVLAEMRKWEQRMDYADAGAVMVRVLSRAPEQCEVGDRGGWPLGSVGSKRSCRSRPRF